MPNYIHLKTKMAIKKKALWRPLTSCSPTLSQNTDILTSNGLFKELSLGVGCFMFLKAEDENEDLYKVTQGHVSILENCAKLK